MKFFLDTANITEINQALDFGFVDGITTNQSILIKETGKSLDIIKEMCSLIDGPVNVPIISDSYDEMVSEGRALAAISRNICVQIPITKDGIKACKYLVEENIMTNMTLCFSAAQALLVAKAGANFISPFIGRFDDTGIDGMYLIRDIKKIYENYPEYQTEIIVSSTRNALHVVEAAKIGADIVSIPFRILSNMYKHSMTEAGIKKFSSDWNNRPSIAGKK